MKVLAEFKEVYTDIRDLIYSIALIEYGEDSNKYRGYKFDSLTRMNIEEMYFIAKIKYYTEKDISTYEIHIKDSKEDNELMDIAIFRDENNRVGDTFIIQKIVDMLV